MAFFGKSNLNYYTVDNATLGASGKSFFFMPLEDAVGETGGLVFSGLSAGVNILGTAMDPNSTYSLNTPMT
ncbi:hypothetical protein GCM10027066_19580 [Dyella jejuensis]